MTTGPVEAFLFFSPDFLAARSRCLATSPLASALILRFASFFFGSGSEGEEDEEEDEVEDDDELSESEEL